MALALAGCASNAPKGTSHYSRYYSSSGAYRAPGPAEDPWKPYIEEASNRFAVPQPWIRAVIQKESGGHEYMDGHPITSASGAMGLMQLMPQTYGDMQKRNHLGSDPYDPRNNILAGTAYIRTLYGLYGAPGFLAAYNAGIERLNDYLEDGRPLPSQTVRYLRIITPNLGNSVALSGPLAIYAGPGQPVTRTPVALGGRNQHAVLQYATLNPPAPTRTPPAQATTRCVQDPDAAYDPSARCTATTVTASAGAGVNYGAWSVQVGAFSTEGQARFATTMARQGDFATLQGARSMVIPVTSARGTPVYRARLAGLSQAAAGRACSSLKNQGLLCIVIRPGM
ncbi:lytic transglycosylase domain-containing protein [Novacetimonas cocois]|uniref:Lytic transglycosylase n=1 Tax=Novacetimonas cocois TaxID=1747507 RepID=A0A365YV87_9PROT|nr:lytic transglycosylase domain-containing protein [Novacetimonas cocois]RBM06195.1 lytic transglycosylase [Novacetimonas cocois]